MQAADSAAGSAHSPLARVRHDLLTPINGIIGYAGILLEDAADVGQAGMLGALDGILGAARAVERDIRTALEPGAARAVERDIRTALEPGAAPAPLDTVDAACAARLAGTRPAAEEMLRGAEALLHSATSDAADPAFVGDLRQLAASARELAGLLRTVPLPPAG